MIACTDMKNVCNHVSGAIKWIGCALYQCVRVIPVPAWMLKLGNIFEIFLPLKSKMSFLSVKHLWWFSLTWMTLEDPDNAWRNLG